MSKRLTAILMTCLALPVLTLPALAQPGAHFVENWDLDEDGQVTLAEATERRSDIFLSFDADDNGTIDAEEYKMFDEARAADMEGQGNHANSPMKNAEAGMHLTYNDVDGDGAVSREEFLGRAPDWFADMDHNGDGVITVADFRRP